MTHLRKMMLEELQRRNYAQTTIRSYIRIMEDFSRRFQRAPNRLGPKHIREYQSELFTKRKFAASTVTVYLAALRFFYTKTLKRAWSTTETPYPKRVFALPTILSQEEVTQLIDAARPALHRTLLMTLYATGLLRAELALARADSERLGGSGLIVVNPPWRLEEELSVLMPALAQALGAAPAGAARLDWLAREK